MLRSLFMAVLSLAILAGAGSARAAAADIVWLGDRACTFYGDAAWDPAIVIEQRRAPCRRADEPPAGRATYMVVSGLDLVAQPGDPLEFSHRTMRLHDERVFFRFADGEVTEAPTPAAASIRPLTTTEMYFPVPWRQVPLVAVLVKSRGFENGHGVADRARIAPASFNRMVAMRQHLLYGLFGGAIMAMILYNLMLWRGLRYDFILNYCLIGLAMIGFGLSWSGVLGVMVPGIDPNRLIALNLLAYATLVATVPDFLMAFLERDLRPTRLLLLARASALIAVAASLTRLAGFDAAWRALDMATYTGVLGAVIAMGAASVVALARGSVAVRYFLVAWTIPLGFAVWRTLWGMGLSLGDGPTIDIAPFAIMALESILSALGMAWRIRSLRTERDDAQAVRAGLQKLADTDPMTGLLNRRAFLDRAARRGLPQRLMLIDIDRFKAINDCMGHEAGDRVIVAVSILLVAEAPPGALVGRLGGEEFAILADARNAEGLDDRLLRAIAKSAMPEGLTVTCSAGIALGHVSGSGDWERLYREADSALYRAKAGGRDRVCQPGLPAAA